MLNYPFLVNKVNSARNCIEACHGKNGGDSCFISCVNVHWPGTTFEDADNDLITITKKRKGKSLFPDHHQSMSIFSNLSSSSTTGQHTSGQFPQSTLIPSFTTSKFLFLFFYCRKY